MQKRKFLADTFAMVVFSTVVGMVIEILISNMTVEQSVNTRLIAVPLNLFTARPYSIFRDWVSQIAKADKSGQIRKGIADVLAYILFQVPLYMSILLVSGTNSEQMMIACGTFTAFSAFVGRPYGLFLELSRWFFGIK